jgi:hypothetical protein
MRIGGIGSSTIGSVARRAPAAQHDGDIDLEETRALIAVEAAAPVERLVSTMRHPAAPFLAQLIATRMQMPQTRARRRAEPEEAIGVYRSSNDRAHPLQVRKRFFQA